MAGERPCWRPKGEAKITPLPCTPSWADTQRSMQQTALPTQGRLQASEARQLFNKIPIQIP